MTSQDTKALIAGGVRTVLQAVPVVGGAIAQAWSEYEGHKRNERIEEFFRDFGERLKALEEEAEKLTAQLNSMKDFPRLLEDTVAAVQRETDDAKRKLYPRFLVNIIVQASQTSADERSFLLETVESLTKWDIDVLKKFDESGQQRGDWLTGTTQGGWRPVGGQHDREIDVKYQKLLGPTMISTAKLEARGIIVQTPNRYAINFVGTGGEWYDIYRTRFWRLMPIGYALLNAVE